MASKVYDIHCDGDAFPMAYSPNKGVVVPLPDEGEPKTKEEKEKAAEAEKRVADAKAHVKKDKKEKEKEKEKDRDKSKDTPEDKEKEKEREKREQEREKEEEEKEKKDEKILEGRKEKIKIINELEPGDPPPDGYEITQKMVTGINFPPVNVGAVRQRLRVTVSQTREVPLEEGAEPPEPPEMEKAEYEPIEVDFPTDTMFLDVLLPIGSEVTVVFAQFPIHSDEEAISKDTITFTVPHSPQMPTGITIEYKGQVSSMAPTPEYVLIEPEGEGEGAPLRKTKSKEKEKEPHKTQAQAQTPHKAPEPHKTQAPEPHKTEHHKAPEHHDKK